MNVQQRLRPRRSCRCATSRGGPSAVDGGSRQRWDPRDPRLTDMRWSSVTGRPFTRLQKASVCVDPSEIARSDANLTQVTGVAGEERPADSRGSRRHRSLSEQTSVRALSRTDADDQGDFRDSTSSRCSPRLRPASSTLSTSVITGGAMSARKLAPARVGGAAYCAVRATTNGRPGQVGTESHSRGFRPETARFGAIRVRVIGPWSV